MSAFVRGKARIVKAPQYDAFTVSLVCMYVY